MKSSGIGVSVAIEYKTMIVDGGMSTPKVPPTATQAPDKRFEYPAFKSSGIAIFETVAAVAMADPDTVAKAPQATTDEIANPPGKCPIQAVAARNPLADIPAE
jgi:hypothetical protein